MNESPWEDSAGHDEDWGLAELAGWKDELEEDGESVDPEVLAELVDGFIVGVGAPNWRVPVDRVRDLLFESLADEKPLQPVPLAQPEMIAYQPHPEDPLPSIARGKSGFRLSIERLELPR